MAFGDGGFRTRAASLLRPSLRAASNEEDPRSEKHSISNAEPLISEKPPLKEQASGGDNSLSLSSAGKTRPLDPAIAHDIDANRLVRTIPTWVHSLDEDEDEDPKPRSPLLPPYPLTAQVARHNSSPSARNKHKHDPAPGRLYDLQREWAPPTPSSPVSEHASKWRAFANASSYPVNPADGGELVTEEWLVQNGADYSRPWLAGSENGDAENDGARFFKFQAKRKGWWERLQRVTLRSPIIPLVIRTNVWLFSLVALALGGSIHGLASKSSETAKAINGLSPKMAIIVDAIALVYLLYITYDEYSGKPLGLRSAGAKMRLIFLDLFFIVFDSANLSLAFEAVSDSNQECQNLDLRENICHQQKGLASVLLIALIAWLLAFSISVLRVVERVTGK